MFSSVNEDIYTFCDVCSQRGRAVYEKNIGRFGSAGYLMGGATPRKLDQGLR